MKHLSLTATAGFLLAIASPAAAQVYNPATGQYEQQAYADPNANVQQQQQQPVQQQQVQQVQGGLYQTYPNAQGGYAVDPNAQQVAQDPAVQYADPNAQQPTQVVQQPQDAQQQAVVDPNAQAAQLPAAEDDTAQQYDDGYDPQAYNQFQSALAPYGTWQDSADYGHIWVPNASIVGADFQPYGTGGHWVMTEAGWTWVSDYDWGWAPFHYGRWIRDGGYGWAWVPGTVWGPAWVSWRNSGGYVGWAPMTPYGMRWGNGYNPWRFVPSQHLGWAHPAYVGAGAIPGLLARASVINTPRSVSVGGVNVRINAGPTFVPGVPGVNVSLRSVSSAVYPRVNVVPRLGSPVATRPWMQPRTNVGGVGMQGARPMGVYAQPRYAQPAYAQPRYVQPAYVQPRYAQPAYAQPVYRSAPVYNAPRYAQPVYRSAPVYSSPRYSSPSYGGGGYRSGGYSGGGGYHGGGYHGGGGFGGGGYHGGGGGGGFHSSGGGRGGRR